VGRLATARFKHGIASLESGQVLVLGGTPNDATLLTSTELYNPATGRFSRGPDMVSGRYKLTSSVVALPGDRVVVAGGDGVELVDVMAGRSAVIPQLRSRRQSFSTVGVTGGQLVIVGGYDESIRLTRTYSTFPLDDL
jgi:hypothetical protein